MPRRRPPRPLVVAATLLTIAMSPAASGAEPAAPISLADDLAARAQRLFELEGTPGMAVAAVQDGRIVLEAGFGLADVEAGRPVTTGTRFYIASTTKSLTAFAAIQLARRGELDLDAPLSRLLPDLRLAAPLDPATITLRDLIGLTHGIEDSGPVVFRTAFSGDFDRETLLRLLAEYGPAEQGRAFRYGNLGYNIAGMVLEEATGESWKTVVEREVLKPAGMDLTTAWRSRVPLESQAMPYRPADDGFERAPYAKGDANLHAAGGHLSTAGDMARWVALHLDAGVLDGRQAFPAEAVAESHRQHVEQERTFDAIQRWGWGLGWDLGTWEGETLIHRFGSFPGFRSHVSFMPERGVGVVVLVNEGTLGSHLADAVAWALYDRLLERPDTQTYFAEHLAATRATLAEGREALRADRARRANRSQTLPHPLAAYAGRYVNDEIGTLEIDLTGNRLQARAGEAESGVEVYDAQAEQLRLELTGGGSVATMVFADGEGQKAIAVEWLGRRFERVED